MVRKRRFWVILGAIVLCGLAYQFGARPFLLSHQAKVLERARRCEKHRHDEAALLGYCYLVDKFPESREAQSAMRGIARCAFREETGRDPISGWAVLWHTPYRWCARRADESDNMSFAVPTSTVRVYATVCRHGAVLDMEAIPVPAEQPEVLTEAE